MQISSALPGGRLHFAALPPKNSFCAATSSPACTCLSPPTQRASARRALMCRAGSSANGGDRAAGGSGEMARLVRQRYFRDLFTNGDWSAAREILHPDVRHLDMVRDEQYEGIGAVKAYMQDVREAYPNFYVEAIEVGPSDSGDAIFAAFEGRATEDSPLFRGVDLFRFDPSGKKIVEVQVYRSNWQGAKGHQQRKAAREEAAAARERHASGR